MANLPLEINRSTYTRYFLPTCFHVIGEHVEPFTMLHENVISQLSVVYKTCFPRITPEFTISSMAFLVVKYPLDGQSHKLT